MTTAEIIMQKKKIAAEKEKAEQKLAYDTIKMWVGKNASKIACALLRTIARFFEEDSVEKVTFRCWSGRSNYPLGKEYPSEVGIDWYSILCKKYKEDKYNVSFIDDFFKDVPIERNEFSENTFKLFQSQLLFHTTLPELFRTEGFIVNHTGCGCSEEITIKLP